MVKLERTDMLKADILAAVMLAGGKPEVATKFFSVFDFPTFDMYSGTFTEFEDFIYEKGYRLMYKEGILLRQTSSIHYVKDGGTYVGYLTDELGSGRLLLKSNKLESAVV